MQSGTFLANRTAAAADHLLRLKFCAVVLTRYTEPSVAQSCGCGGDTLLIRNSLGVEVVIQSLENASLESSDDEEGGGWGGGAPGASWDSSGEYGDVTPEGFPDFFSEDVGGEVVAGATPGAAAAAEHPYHIRDISRPTAVAAGQAIECRLPARTDSRDSSAVSTEFVVHVPGFQAVAGVRVGGRGTSAYQLLTATTSRESAASRKARGVAERVIRPAARGAAPNKAGLALVVDVGEKNSGAGVRSVGDMRRGSTQSDGADQELTASSSSFRGGLVAELRTNVCVHNSSASDVEVDMADMASAAAAIAKTAGASRPKQSQQQDWEATPGTPSAGDGSAAVVRLAAGARLALPLSVLSSWQLRIAGDATTAWSRPLRLSPALLDPAVPNALRFTSDMERNSLCLRLTKSSGRVLSGSGGSTSSAAGAAATVAAAAAARGEMYSHDSSGGRSQILPSSEQRDDGLRRKSSKSVGFKMQHSPKLSSAATSSGPDGFSTSPSSKLPPPGGTGTGSAPFSSGTADWVLIVQPSYLVTNALPCAMEVEVLQPPLSAGNGDARTERSRSWGGSESNVVGPSDETAVTAERWRYVDSNVSSDGDSDTESVTSSVTSRQTQQSEGKARAVASANSTDRAETSTKAAVRNPALDLFFLPSSNSVAERSSTGGGRGGGKARSDSRGDISGDGFGSRVRSGSGVYAGGGSGTGRGEAASGNTSYDLEGRSRKQRGWPVQDLQQREEHDAIREFESVWKGLVSSGQEAKVNLTL